MDKHPNPQLVSAAHIIERRSSAYPLDETEVRFWRLFVKRLRHVDEAFKDYEHQLELQPESSQKRRLRVHLASRRADVRRLFGAAFDVHTAT